MSDNIQTNISTTVENVNVYVSSLTSTNINVIGELVPDNNFETNVTTTVTNIDVSVTDTSATNIVIDYSYPTGPQGPTGPPGLSLWGSISGTLSAQSDLWRYLSAETFSPSQLTAYLASHSLTLCSIDVRGQILSAGTSLFNIFRTTDSDSQTLFYTPSSYLLSISNGNTISLSSINTTLNLVSSLLTPLTLTNTLTSQLVTNNTFNSYQTNVANATATLLPTSIYQGASGFWQGASTIVQQGSSNWYSASGAVVGYTHTNFLPLSGGTVTGNLSLQGNLSITGSATYINTQNLVVDDALIYLANNNTANLLDIGFVAHFTQSPLGYQHTGLVRRAGQGRPGVWTLFSGLTTEPISANNLDWNDRNITVDTLSANLLGNVIGNTIQANNSIGVGAYTPNYFNLDVNGQSGNGTIGSSYGDLDLGAAGNVGIYPNNYLVLSPVNNIIVRPSGDTTTLPNEKLTVVGNISSSNVVYAQGGNSNLWNEAYKLAVNTLPVPKVIFSRLSTPIPHLSGIGSDSMVYAGNFNLYQYPRVVTQGLTQELLDNYSIFVEMIIFKGKRKRGGNTTSGYTTPNAWPDVKPWAPLGGSFWTRSGGDAVAANTGVNRYNQLPVTSINEVINLSPCFHGRFRSVDVSYLDSTNAYNYDPAYFKYLNCIVPIDSRHAKIRGKISRLGYDSIYKSMYVAFRYIAWLPEANRGRGQIVEGPLSPTIRVANIRWPFNTDHFNSSLKGFAVVTLNANFQREYFKCTFV